MKNIDIPTFKRDQYFTIKKKYFADSSIQIEKIVKEDDGVNKPYEKVWIPEDQIKGSIKKIDRISFEKINECFLNNFKDNIEKGTGLDNLELVAVRRNILKKNDSVSMHKDVSGYVVIINIPKPEDEDQDENNPKNSNTTFEGGNILFKKDNGETVEIELNSDEILVAKCTNEHGVKKILSGTRESIALFSRPKLN